METSRLLKRLKFGKVMELGGTDSVTVADDVTDGCGAGAALGGAVTVE